MTLDELKLVLAKAHWGSFKTGLAWEEINEFNRERYMNYASVMIEAIWDAGYEVAPRDATIGMREAAVNKTYDILLFSLEPGEGLDDVDWKLAWTTMLSANPLRRPAP